MTKSKGQRRAEKNKKRTQSKLFRSKNKDTTVTHNKDGSKTYTLGKEASENIDNMVQAFTDFFGRPPEKGDPLLFDPDYPDKPTAMSESKINSNISNILEKSGMPPEFMYAFEQTGLLRNPLNEHLLSDKDKQDWDDALKRFRDMEGCL